MKFMIKLSIGMVVVFVLFQSFLIMSTDSTEEQKYTVVRAYKDFEIRLYWCDCSGGVFLYGAGTADSADGNPAGDDEKGTADSYEL